jgi:hypothetical protein
VQLSATCTSSVLSQFFHSLLILFC